MLVARNINWLHPSTLVTPYAIGALRSKSTRPNPAVATKYRSRDSFDKHMPSAPFKEKPWDRRGISKDEFFGKKYGHISPIDRDRLDKKVERQRRARAARKEATQQSWAPPKHAVTEKPPPPESHASNSERERSAHIEYVFGTHVVRLVLKAQARKYYGDLHAFKCKDSEVIRFALKDLGLRVRNVESAQDLKKLVGKGVHNGLVLETSPLVLRSIHAMTKAVDRQFSISVYDEVKDTHSPQIAIVRRPRAMHPLGVFLDGITDPQNLGGIVRSAFFFGADFVLVPESNSARMGPVANKASAGALDLLPIYTVAHPVPFCTRIQAEGWNVVATSADVIEHECASTSTMKPIDATTGALGQKLVPSSDLASMLEHCPMLLVLGSEGLGVCRQLRAQADYLVGIEKAVDDDIYVDSLNVNVAAGVLLSKCVGN